MRACRKSFLVRRVSRREAPRIAALAAALSVLAMFAGSIRAAEAPPPAAEPAGGDGQPAAETPNSTEQGQTQITDSFEHRPVAALLRESRLVGLRDTTLAVQLRSYDLDRDNFNTSQSQAWTLGGSAGFKTGYFANFAALGLTGYTSQHLDAPADKDGTKLLQTGQRAYTVLGELYGDFRLTDQIRAIAGYRGFSTPFINTQDSLMTPNTFLLYALQGVIGRTDDASTLRFGAGYVDKIKVRNGDSFESMATAAGAPAGVSRGVDVAGATFTHGAFTLGVVDYYSSDIINITYVESKYAIPLAAGTSIRVGAQYTDQRSTGQDLLTGSSFSGNQYGLKAELAMHAFLLTVARTVTGVGEVSKNGNGTDLRNPWGGYPGYTAVQIENFYRAGEDATLVRLAYNFPKYTGLTAYALLVKGTAPQVAGQYAQSEYDFNVQWVAQAPALKGITLLARYGHVSQAGSSDQHEDELRLVLYYQLR